MKNRKLKLINKEQGFTILELTIALSIFSVITIFMIHFYLAATKAYTSSVSARSSEQNIRVAMETITRFLRESRSVEEIKKTDSNTPDAPDGNSYITLRMQDDSHTDYIVKFRRMCVTNPEITERSDLTCNGQRGYVGDIEMAQYQTASPPQSIDYQPLTSTDVNITGFKLMPSPGIPPIISVTLEAQIDGSGNNSGSLDQGLSGNGTIKMTTSAMLKGQYY